MFTGIIREVGSLKSKIRRGGGAGGGGSAGVDGAEGMGAGGGGSADVDGAEGMGAGGGGGGTNGGGAGSGGDMGAAGGGSADVDGAEGMGADGAGRTSGTGTDSGVVTLVISCKKLRPKPGDSVCVNGVCLTVTKKIATGFEVDVVRETLKRTNLGELSTGAADRGSALNLEPALQARDTVDGHFVTGHVDAVARVIKAGVARNDGAKNSGTKNDEIKNGTELTIKMPRNLMQFIAYKGSVTINGVSLTVGAIKNTEVTVALIPFTRKNTNLGLLKKGDTVNVEIDLIARYLYNFDNLRM